MTNYESIKAMGVNELAGFLASITTCCNCPAYRNCDGHVVCTAALLEWLADESKVFNFRFEQSGNGTQIGYVEHFHGKKED